MFGVREFGVREFGVQEICGPCRVPNGENARALTVYPARDGGKRFRQTGVRRLRADRGRAHQTEGVRRGISRAVEDAIEIGVMCR